MTDTETASGAIESPPEPGSPAPAPDVQVGQPASRLMPLAIVLWGPATFIVVLLLIAVMLRAPSAYMALTAFPYCILMIGVAQLVPVWDTPDFALYGGIGLAFLIWIIIGTLYVRVLRELPKASRWSWEWMLRFMYAGMGSAIAYSLVAGWQLMVIRQQATEHPAMEVPPTLSPLGGVFILVVLAIWHDAMTGVDVRRWLGIEEAEVRRRIRSAWGIVVVVGLLGLGYWYLGIQSYTMGLSQTQQFKLNIVPWQDDPMPTVEEWESNQ